MVLKIKTGLCLLITMVGVGIASARINFGCKQSAFKFAGSSKFHFLPTNFSITGGTMQRGENASFVGNRMVFDNGVMTIGNVDIGLTGQVNAGTTNSILLNGNCSFDGMAGVATPVINVSGGYNRIDGDVQFGQDNGIQLLDSTTTLTIALKGSIDFDIVLNGGTVILENSLSLADDATFVSAGTIKSYGNPIFMGGKNLIWPTGTYNWKEATVIYLNSNIDIQGRWNVYDKTYIIGNGNVLNLEDLEGKIRVMPDSTLFLSDVKLRGFDSHHLEFGNKASQLVLNRVEIEMDEDYTLTTGGVFVENSSTIITKNNYLTFDLGSSLTVSGCLLWYDPLDYPDVNNIQPSASVDPHHLRLTFIDGGTVKSIKSSQAGAVVVRDDTYNLTDFRYTNEYKPFIIESDTTLNGGDNVISFAKTTGQLITISAGVTLTIENADLKDFLFNHIELLSPTTSHIYFGDKTKITMGDNYELSDTYTFRGNCILNGNGHALTFGARGGIEVDANASLKLENITLKNLSQKKLRCLDNTSTMSFAAGVKIYLGDDYFFDQGRFVVATGTLDIRGTDSFVYQSSKRSFIEDEALLKVSDGAIFYYAPSVANHDLIVFNGYDAGIDLYNATLASTTTGMHLTGGRFYASGERGYIKSIGCTSVSEGITFGDAVSVTNNMKTDKGTLEIVEGIFVWANL